MKKSKTINIRVTEDFAALLKSEAARSGLSQSDLIESAVDLFAKIGKVFTEKNTDEAYDKEVNDAVAYHIALWTNNQKTPNQ